MLKALLKLAVCFGVVVTPLQAQTASIAVSFGTNTIATGATTQATARARNASGTVVSGLICAWSSRNPAATVSSSGLVTGVAPGTAAIECRNGAITGSRDIRDTARVASVPTSVMVAPASTSLLVGASAALTATVQDQNGNTMSGQPIAWASSAPAIASVTAGGVVSAVSAGAASITATSSGKSGTSAVNVTAATPPPAGLLFQEPFDNANVAARGWYDNTSPAISTTEHAAGSPAALQFSWGAGATTPASGGAMRHKFAATSSVYISADVKYSANWVGSGQDYHPHEFHILSNLDDDWTGPSDAFLTTYMEHNYQNGGRPKLATQDNRSINTTNGALPNNLVNTTEVRSVSGCNGVSEANVQTECFSFSTASGYYNLKGVFGPTITTWRGAWNHVEAYFQMNSIAGGKAVGDGVMQYWFNGQLVIDRHDIVFRTGAHPTLQFAQFGIAPYIGDGSPVVQSMWIDNLVVATARSGGPAIPPPVDPVVTSVTVAPSSAALAVGATQSLRATVKDQNGNTMSGQSVTWASSAPSVASVSTNGTVSGVSAGTASIAASVGAVSGASGVTVSAIVVPPPSDSTSHEPAGMSLLVERAWNALSENGWYDDNTPSKYAIVQDAGAPKSPANVGQQTYPAGMGGGGSPAVAEKGIGSKQTIYISYWVKLSSNFVGHGSDVNKQIFVWTANQPAVYTTAQGSGSGCLRPEVHTQGTGETKNYEPNLVANACFTRGVWHRWEIVMTLNTAGGANGKLDYWLDGVKLGSFSDVRYNSGSGAWNLFQFSPTWGGIGGSVPAAQYIWIDHLYISGK